MVADASWKKENPIIFITDGLLKELLLAAPDNRKLPCNLIMLDEVHERG